MQCTATQLAGLALFAVYSIATAFSAPLTANAELKFEVVIDRNFDLPEADFEVFKRSPGGNVYLLSPKSRLLVAIPATGGQPETIALDEILPESDSGRQRLLPAMAFDSDGHIYLQAHLPGQTAPNYGVYVIDSGGAFVRQVELQNAWEFGEFAVDSAGRFYATRLDQGPGMLSCAQVHQYEPDGRFVRSFPRCQQSEPFVLPHFAYLGKRPTSLWVENDRIFFAPPKDHRLMVIGTDGKLEETRYLSSPPVESVLQNRGFLVTPDIPAEVLSARAVGENGLLLAWRRSGMLYVSFNTSQGAVLSAALPASQMDGWPLGCDANGECDIVWQSGTGKVFIRRVRIVVR